MANILFVEDDRTIALGVRYSLEQEGFSVSVAHTYREAQALLDGGTYDLALLDVGLPDGSGYDLCTAIAGRFPVIFLTACDEEANVVMGLDMGADDYIAKPFRLRELVSRIQAVLRRAGGGSAEIRYGDLLLNIQQAKVYKNGALLSLTPLEFRLLRTLLVHRGQTLTRDQLIQDIWDIAGNFVNDNTLTVCIKRLREKIERDPAHPDIVRTVRGIGYRVEAQR